MPSWRRALGIWPRSPAPTTRPSRRPSATFGCGEFTYRKPSRRQPPGGALLPRHQRPIPRVLVIADTSGSMGERDLGLALGVIARVLRKLPDPRGVEVWTGDTQVGSAQRVFRPEQAESGLSLEAQRQECYRYWERFLKPKAVAWADLIADEAVSAFKKPLAKRKGGQQLSANLRRGDHAIMMRFDRAFRSMRDFVDTYSTLESSRITSERIKAVEIEGIVAWDKLSAIAQQAAGETYAAKPDAVRRTWSESTVRRAVDGFWRLVHIEGTEWISDPALNGRVSGLTRTTPSS